MNIQREIDGKEYSFALTSDEMQRAYLFQEHIYDVNDIRDELMNIHTDSGYMDLDAFENAFSVSLDVVYLNDYMIDLMADEKRMRMDKYGAEWDAATKEAITSVMTEKRYENARLSVRLCDALFSGQESMDRTAKIEKDLENHEYEPYLGQLKDIAKAKYTSNPKQCEMLLSLASDLEAKQNMYQSSLAACQKETTSAKLISSKSSLDCKSEDDILLHLKENADFFSRLERAAPYGGIVKAYSRDPFYSGDAPEYTFVFPGEYQDMLSAFPSKNGIDLLEVEGKLTAGIYGDSYSYVNTGQTHLEEVVAEYQFFKSAEKMEDLKMFLECFYGDVNSRRVQPILAEIYENQDSKGPFMEPDALRKKLWDTSFSPEKVSLAEKIKEAVGRKKAREQDVHPAKDEEHFR